MTEVTVTQPDADTGSVPASRPKPPVRPRNIDRVAGQVPQRIKELVKPVSEQEGVVLGWWGRRRVEKQRQDYFESIRENELPRDSDVPKSVIEERWEQSQARREQIKVAGEDARELLVVFDARKSSEISRQSPEMGQRLAAMNNRVDGLAEEVLQQGGGEAAKVEQWRGEGMADRDIAKRLLEDRLNDAEGVVIVEERYQKLRLLERSLHVRKGELAALLKENKDVLSVKTGERYEPEVRVVTAHDKAEILRGMQKVADMVEDLEEQTVKMNLDLLGAGDDLIGTAEERTGILKQYQDATKERRNGAVIEMRDEGDYITPEVIDREFNELLGQVEAGMEGSLSDEAKEKLEKDLGIRRITRQVTNDAGEVTSVTEVGLEENSVLKRRLQAEELQRAAGEALRSNLEVIAGDDFGPAESGFTALNAELMGEALAEICQVQEVMLAGVNYTEDQLAMAEELGLIERYGELEHVLRQNFAGVRERAGVLGERLGEFFKEKVFVKKNWEIIKKILLILLLIVAATTILTAAGLTQAMKGMAQ